MKSPPILLDSRAFGFAAGLMAVAVSALCALFVALAPQSALSLLSDVVHTDLTSLRPNLTVGTFFGALVFWGIGFGLVFAGAAAIYNRVLRGSRLGVGADMSMRRVA